MLDKDSELSFIYGEYMKYIILFLSVLFCHIVDDYYLQGWLASAKQKDWWKKNAPEPLYENDYTIALIEHGFSWTFMIHLPVIVYSAIFNISIIPECFIIVFAINWIIHVITDNAKANKKKINLIQDQVIHFLQIVATYIFYTVAFII